MEYEKAIRVLKEIGWAAVAVDGFIPPAAFMEFQAYNVLVIASDIRQLDHIEAYLDRESGEIVFVTEDDHVALEAKDDDLIPEWQRETLPKIAWPARVQRVEAIAVTAANKVDRLGGA